MASAPVLIAPAGLRPFGPLKLAVVGAAILGAASFGLPGKRAPTGTITKPVTRALWLFLGTCVLGAAFSQARIVSFLGLHGRYGGLLAVALYLLAFYVAARAYNCEREKLNGLSVSLAAAAIGVSVFVLAQAAGLEWRNWGAGRLPSGTLGDSSLAGGC
ncbi:MAG: hypothetical protein ACRDIU_09385, partial [Actinomycetota bacterium]